MAQIGPLASAMAYWFDDVTLFRMRCCHLVDFSLPKRQIIVRTKLYALITWDLSLVNTVGT